MAHTHTELGSAFRSLTRHEEYYLPGGDLFLLVEHHIFRVHRYFFERESTYFKGKLATPASPGSIRPGTSESSAILLEDVRVHEFARFLWVFYNPKYSLYNTSVADWTAILSLAHRWAFPEVKALAVRELEKQSMPDIGRVVVYQDNQVDPNLLIRCYAALCEREEPLTPAEGRLMGIDTALTIAQLREMARRSPIDCRSPTSANIRGNELYSLVRELFRIGEPTRDNDSLPQTPLAAAGINNNSVNPAVNSTTSTSETDSTDNHTGNDTSVSIVNPNGNATLASTRTGNTLSGSQVNSTKTGTTAGDNKSGSGQGQSTLGDVSFPHSRPGNTINSNDREEKEKEGAKERETNEDGTGTGDGFSKPKSRRNVFKRG
ncbi:hypothetical protein Ac2012v2_005287 [Leucoagaricus gongylophorus]